MIPQKPTPAGLNYSAEQMGGIPVLVLHWHNQVLEPASGIPDKIVISGNLPKSYMESNIQWGNRCVPHWRVTSQT